MYSLLNVQITQIISPVTIIFPDGRRQEFSNGKEAADAKYNGCYDIRSIRAVGNTIEITLEPAETFPTRWVGEEQVSFF